MTEHMHYILDENRKPVAVDMMTWVRSFDRKNRQVDRTELPNGYLVSTVFLGLDHNWGPGPPLIFETMTFPECPDGEQIQDRYSTRDEAKAGHADVCLRAAEWTARRPDEVRP